MHRSAAEGRFGDAEPVGRASVCAGAAPLGVEIGGLDGAQIGRESKRGKLQRDEQLAKARTLLV